MNLSKNSILNHPIQFTDRTIYYSIGYFKLLFSKSVYLEKNQLFYDKNCYVCIEYGEDLTTFIELLRLVYEVRYVEQNSEDNEQRTKTLSRGSTKVFVNPKARKATNEAFLTLFLSIQMPNLKFFL